MTLILPAIEVLRRGKLESYYSQQSLSELGQAISAMTTRQWFCRTWIRQEVYSAYEITLKYGSHEVAFDDFLALTKAMGFFSEALASLSEGFLAGRGEHQIATLMTFSQKASDVKAVPPTMEYKGYAEEGNIGSQLIHILRTNKCFGATEDKDRVYALLGMVPDLILSTTLYRREERGISTLTPFPQIEYLINKYRSLDCLNFFGVRNIHRHSQDLPSWALNWRDTDVCCGPILYTSIDSKPLAQPPVQDIHRTGELHLTGYTIMVLEECEDGGPSRVSPALDRKHSPVAEACTRALCHCVFRP